VVALVNAGIFEPGGIPSGLHVQNGKQLLPLNLQLGRGNFFLKPNGVFAINTEGKARVTSSVEHSTATARPHSDRLALQSSPLLLRNGQPHHAFRAASNSKLHRTESAFTPPPATSSC